MITMIKSFLPGPELCGADGGPDSGGGGSGSKPCGEGRDLPGKRMSRTSNEMRFLIGITSFYPASLKTQKPFTRVV